MIFAMMLLSVWTMASCSEEDNEVEEFPNWQVTNDNYFNHLSDSVKALLAADPSRTDWKRIKTWSKSPETEGVNADYIIVHVENTADAAETASPLYTDSVQVSYVGRLLPSTSYSTGYVFDRTFYGDYDPETSARVKFTTSGVVDGFSTALQSMRRGDRWTVYIPYQLGYNSSASGTIPAYSTLIFDLILVDFWPVALTES